MRKPYSRFVQHQSIRENTHEKIEESDLQFFEQQNELLILIDSISIAFKELVKILFLMKSRTSWYSASFALAKKGSGLQIFSRTSSSWWKICVDNNTILDFFKFSNK